MLKIKNPAHVEKQIARFRGGAWDDVTDEIAVEEPLEIRLAWQGEFATQQKSIAITMRTPGDDFELVAGFLAAEGILRSRDDLADISYCQDEDETQAFNIVTATLRPGVTFDPVRLERNFYTTSSCGVCGKATLESLEIRGCEPLPLGFSVPASIICALPDAARREQPLFSLTGGLHAATLFDARGGIVAIKEDVGRHNALDKLIGSRLLSGNSDLSGCGVFLSGRAGFELIQKALAARVPLVAAVGAPSTLAVDLAERFNLTLAGFVHGGSFNVYAGRERIEAS